MRIGRFLTLVGVVLALAVAVAFLVDLRPSRPAVAPRVLENYRANAELRVGAARVGFRLPADGPVAGYPPPRPTAKSAATPLQVRAVVVESGGSMVAIASAEVLEIPAGLAEEVRRTAREMGLNDVVLAATHTHTGVGGYDPNPVAQIAATGLYDAAAQREIAEALIAAIRDAQSERAPARVRTGRATVEEATANRAWIGGPVDRELRAVELTSASGEPIARIVIFGSHPTLVGREGEQLDGDYPGRVMRALEGDGSVAIFLQGAFGDVRSRPPEGEAPPVERMAAIVTSAAREALAVAQPVDGGIAYAAAKVVLPPAQAEGALPRLARRFGANLLDRVMPESGDVEVLELGEEHFLFTPVEPTVAAAEALRAALGEWGRGAAVFGLANGYLGYLEIPERFAAGTGESKRTLYGPELLGRLEGGLKSCVEALGEAR